MAISILSQPATHTPAYNNQYFVLNSDNRTQLNFKYVVKVTVDGTTTTEKYDPHPTTGNANIDPQRIAESYVNNTFNIDAARLEIANDSIKSIHCQFSEEYGNPISGFAVSASALYYVWNAAYNPYDFSTYTLTSGNAKLLSQAPTTTNEFVTSTKTLYSHLDNRYNFITWHRAFESGGDVTSLYIEAYNISLILYQTTVITNSFNTIGSSYQRNLQYFNFSPYGTALILSTYPSTVTRSNNSFAIIPGNTKVAIAWLRNAATAQVSEKIAIIFDDYCGKYDRYTLYFLNRYGNYDWFVFNKISRRIDDKEILEYKKHPFTKIGNDYVYNNYTSNTITYSTTIKQKITLNSDWISDDQSTMLLDLFMSPDIKMEDKNNNLFSVKIKNTSYEAKKKVNDKVFNITVDLEYEYNDIRQRG